MGDKGKFRDNLNERYGITLLTFYYNGKTFKIRATEHSILRFKEKGINTDIACGDIISLGKERLYNYAETGDDVAIIDVDNNITTIITFEEYENKIQIRIRTIIPKSNIWIRKGTKICNIEDKL